MTLNDLIQSGIHQLFFPSMKVPSKVHWRKNLAKYGDISDIELNRKGKKLTGLLIKPFQGEVKGTVIFAHPLSKRAKFFYGEGSRLQMYLDLGYQCLLFDFNGFGDSHRLDLYFWQDTVCAIEYAKGHFSELPMVLHGVSFGSFHAIRAIPSLPQNSKVVLENTNRSLYDYWKHWPHTKIAVKILELKFISPGFIRDMNVIEVFDQLDRPDLNVLFITCSDDDLTPKDEMIELASHFKMNKTFLHTEDTQHLEASTKAAADYQIELKRLLEA